MAEPRATRLPPEEPADSTQDARQALEELRRLLIEPEQQEIATLKEHIENPTVRAEDISAVVAEAIELRRTQGGGPAITSAITPSVEEGLRESVRKDPQVLADALFPVMGPAIRKSITDAIRSMLESFNKAMEHSLSIRGLQWRIESFRTGKPFAEVVLLHSLLYRVEQVFLIHRETGLQLGHCVAPEVASQDPDLVAGMFSAIRDFVRDSFHAPAGESLDSLQVGDLQVWVEEGPYATLAAVIRGHAPADYRTTLRDSLEKIHQHFGRELEQFDGDASALRPCEPYLHACLETRLQEHARRRPKPYFWVLLSVLIVLLMVWFGLRLRENRQWNRFAQALGSQPGIVLTSWERSGGRFRFHGMRDPLAVDPAALLQEHGLNREQADFSLASYYALDDAILAKRVAAALSAPPGVQLRVVDGVVHVEGEALSEWIAGIQKNAAAIPGVRGFEISRLVDEARADFGRKKSALEEALILFDAGQATLFGPHADRTSALAGEIKELLDRAAQLREPVFIELTGHCDSTGAEAANLLLSRQRAEQVRREMVRRGVPSQVLRTRGAGSSLPVRTGEGESAMQYNRSVSFRVVRVGSE